MGYYVIKPFYELSTTGTSQAAPGCYFQRNGINYFGLGNLLGGVPIGRANSTSTPNYPASNFYTFTDNTVVVWPLGQSCVLQMESLVLPPGERGVAWAPNHRVQSSDAGITYLRSDLASNGSGVLPYQNFGYSVIPKTGPGYLAVWPSGPLRTQWMHPLYQLTDLQLTMQVEGVGSPAIASELRINVQSDLAPNPPTILSPLPRSIQSQGVAFNWVHSDPEGIPEKGFRVIVWNDVAVTGGQEYGAPTKPGFPGFVNHLNPPYHQPLSTAQAVYDSGILLGAHGPGLTTTLFPGNYWAYIYTSDGIGALGYEAHPYSLGKPAVVYFTVFGANQRTVV